MYLTTCLLSITIYISAGQPQNIHDDLQFDHNNLLNVMPFEDNEQTNKHIRQIRRSILRYVMQVHSCNLDVQQWCM